MKVAAVTRLKGTASANSFAWVPIALVGIFGLVFALLAGAVAATGNIYLVLGILAIGGGVFVISAPAIWTVWLLFVASFLVLGPVIYFFGFSQLQWVPALMGGALLMQVLMHTMRAKKTMLTNAPSPAFLTFLILFLITAIFGTLIDNPKAHELINSSRWYFFFWPVMLAFMLGVLKPHHIESIWKFLIAVLLIQFPFALYQYFFVVKQSMRAMTPWDSVVGTFPGSEDTGGQSAAMAIFVLVALLLAFALWRAKRLHGGVMLLAGICALGYLALAEVKAAVLLLPAIVVLYYWRELGKHPFQALLLFLAACAAIIVLFAGYERFYYAGHTYGETTEPRTAISDVQNALDPAKVSRYRPQIGRITHFIYWWGENVRTGDIQHALLGHGMGAVHATRLGVGDVAGKYPIRMDVSSSTILLWETGLLGHLLFMAMLTAAAVLSARMARQTDIPEWHRIALRVGALGLLLIIMTLPYKDMALRSTGVVLLTMLLIGQAAYWWRATHQNTNPKTFSRVSPSAGSA